MALGAAAPAFAIDGCTNQNIMGTYNAQITSAALTNVVNTLNASAGSTASVMPGGFGNNPASISGSAPALSRFYFDGSGNVLGGSSIGNGIFVQAGVYSVATNCTAAITLNTGQHYNAVVVSGGNQVLVLQSDIGSNGVTGTLVRSDNTCNAPQYPTSFGFSYYGASAQTAASGAAAATLSPYSAIGTLSLDGAGNFTMIEYVVNGSLSSQAFSASGTYSVNNNCSLSLSFAAPAAGASGVLTPPAAFSALIGTTPGSSTFNGLITVQPTSGVMLPGVVISQ